MKIIRVFDATKYLYKNIKREEYLCFNERVNHEKLYK